MNGGEVLKYLYPNEEWTITGSDFDSIIWHKGDCPLTKEEFENALKELPNWIEKDKKEIELAKKNILEKLGITEDEAKLLLS